jgi:hypothetical protein
LLTVWQWLTAKLAIQRPVKLIAVVHIHLQIPATIATAAAERMQAVQIAQVVLPSKFRPTPAMNMTPPDQAHTNPTVRSAILIRVTQSRLVTSWPSTLRHRLQHMQPTRRPSTHE